MEIDQEDDAVRPLIVIPTCQLCYLRDIKISQICGAHLQTAITMQNLNNVKLKRLQFTDYTNYHLCNLD